MTTESVCPKCGGTGWIIVERANFSARSRAIAAPRAARNASRTARRFRRSIAMPPSIISWCPDPITPSPAGSSPTSCWPSRTTCATFPNEARPGLLLIGEPGTGKIAPGRGRAAQDRREGLRVPLLQLPDAAEYHQIRLRSGFQFRRPGGLPHGARQPKCCCWTTSARTASPIGWKTPSTSIVTYRCDNRKALIATTNLPEPDAGSVATHKSPGRPVRIPHHPGRAHRRARPLASLRDVHGDPHAADRGLPHPKGQAVLKRLAALLLLFAALPAPPRRPPHEYVQAVEFPYYLYPRTLWERELVWLKTIGVSTVEFSIPLELAPTPARRVRFHRPHQPAPRPGGLRPAAAPARSARLGAPAAADGFLARNGACARKALREQRARHPDRQPRRPHRLRGRPRAGHRCRRSSRARGRDFRHDPSAFIRSREAMAGRPERCCGPTWKTRSTPPAGRPTRAAAAPGRRGVEWRRAPRHQPLRRDAALLRNWARLFPGLHPWPCPNRPPASCPRRHRQSNWSRPPPPPSASPTAEKAISRRCARLRAGVEAHPDDSRVSVPAGESLWLPLGRFHRTGTGLCRECTQFPGRAYRLRHRRTALHRIRERHPGHGIRRARWPGEVILQLARQPVGPFLASGKPTEFDWDDKTLRARLTIPASSRRGNRVRIGIAIEAPDTSAFLQRRAAADHRPEERGLHGVFVGGGGGALAPAPARRLHRRAHRQIAGRDRLRNRPCRPMRCTAIGPNLALEADGMPLGRARLQMFRPATIR
jgi:hypothetical protein